tara:strand:- start:786 stop:1007 length:222 start_codon:yes stop_codon:yes gene_type:complete
MNIVFEAKTKYWSTMWKKKLLKIVPIKTEYNIWYGSELLHKEINMHEMIEQITDITGKVPLFKTNRQESILHH